MSIYFSGSFSKSGGVIHAITKQIKLVNLKAAKKVQVQFDPFHPQAVTAREFLFHITAPKVLATNLNCPVKTNVVCDRSDPTISVSLQDGRTIKFLASNLSVLEILQQFNKHISSLVKPEEPTKVLLTKSEKKKTKRK